MKVIKVSKPNFSEAFISCVNTAKRKGATVNIEHDYTSSVYLIQVIVNKRNVGKFTFRLDKENSAVVLTSKMVIERDFYPFELMLFEFRKYFKRKKIKEIYV